MRLKVYIQKDTCELKTTTEPYKHNPTAYPCLKITEKETNRKARHNNTKLLVTKPKIAT